MAWARNRGKLDTPLDENVEYPLVKWENAGDLLRDRITEIAGAIQVVFGSGKRPTHMWLGGSQVRGVSHSGHPDIDVAFFHPEIRHDTREACLDVQEKTWAVLDRLDFRVDLHFADLRKKKDFVGFRVCQLTITNP